MSSTSTINEVETYRYHQLNGHDTIRILVLHPAADFTAPLQCRLEHESLEDIRNGLPTTAFNAMSYACGDGKPSEPLLIEEEDSVYGFGMLKITPNVDGMLRRFRDDTESLRLWIDAVCIDQFDIDEKSAQVQRLDVLYRSATRVVIWLGESDETTQVAFALLKTFVRMAGQSQPALLGMALQPILSKHGWTLDRLLHRLWFSRRWTLQEASLAYDCAMVCGNQFITWPEFRSAIDFLDQAQRGHLFGRTALVDQRSQLAMQAVLRLNRYSGNLLDILWDFDQRECREKNDKIYAVLGLLKRPVPADVEISSSIEVKISSDEDLLRFINQMSLHTESLQSPTTNGNLSNPHHGLEVKVDYRTPWHELYTDIASHFVKTGGFAAITRHLHAFGSLSECNSDWPSWVPNWSHTRKIEPKGGLTNKVPFVAPIPVVDHCLQIHGGQVGQVEAIVMDSKLDISEIQSILFDVVSSTVDRYHEKNNTNDVDEIAAAKDETIDRYKLAMGTLFRAGLDSGLLDRVVEETEEMSDRVVINGLAATAISRVVFDADPEGKYDGLREGILASMKHTVVFTSSDGSLGLTGNFSQVGDLVVDLHHYHALPDTVNVLETETSGLVLKTAAILRPVVPKLPEEGGQGVELLQDRQDRYRLIGPCLYISRAGSEVAPVQIETWCVA